MLSTGFNKITLIVKTAQGLTSFRFAKSSFRPAGVFFNESWTSRTGEFG